jgi:hypothetical protein
MAVMVMMLLTLANHGLKEVMPISPPANLSRALAGPAAGADERGRQVMVEQRMEAVVQMLTTERHYMGRPGPDLIEYDPRFLVFEFSWNLVLRKSQLEMVEEFKRTLDRSGSLCQQREWPILLSSDIGHRR